MMTHNTAAYTAAVAAFLGSIRDCTYGTQAKDQSAERCSGNSRRWKYLACRKPVVSLAVKGSANGIGFSTCTVYAYSQGIEFSIQTSTTVELGQLR